MADKAQLLALAERVEAAAGADAELDIEIAFGIAGQKRPPKDDIYMRVAPPPAYTASIDAALTLVPEEHCWSLDTIDWMPEAIVAPLGPDLSDPVKSATPALALVAASLKARAALSGEPK